MEIRLIGDTHGENNHLISHNRQGDYLIILGDFGYYGRSLDKLQKCIDKIQPKGTNPNCKVLVVDGNHENFPALEAYPDCELLGSTAKQLSKDIFWLRRGEVYTINGKTFLVFGGAFSIDRAYRKYNVSWFDEEEYNFDEFKKLEHNIKKYNYKFDYILTHDAPNSIVNELIPSHSVESNRTSSLLDCIYRSCDFDWWYFGHHHKDIDLDRFSCLYLTNKKLNI